MEYYAIQVKTTGEDDFIRRVPIRDRAADGRLFAPKRALDIRKGGTVKKKLMPVFPGYVFLETPELTGELRWTIRRTPGFYRFLKDSQRPTQLTDRDRRVLLHFISFGEFADTSKVSFDENERIVVHTGPLRGLEGRIVKVDRRRGRAKVALDLCETGFLIDLGFELVEKATKGGEQPHDGEQGPG